MVILAIASAIRESILAAEFVSAPGAHFLLTYNVPVTVLSVSLWLP